jgi:hypothetical protein
VEDEHVAARVGAVLEHASVAVAEKLVVPAALHSTAAEGPLQVTVGADAVITSVSLQVALLPALSVAVQTTTMPLLPSFAAIVRLPSAFTVQPVQPAGQAHATVAAEQVSVAVADTVKGAPLQASEVADMEQVTVGGVVSTTESVLLQVVVWPPAAVAV